MKISKYRIFIYSLLLLLTSLILVKQTPTKVFVLGQNTTSIQTLGTVSNLKLASVNCANKDIPIATFTWDVLSGANLYKFSYKNTATGIQSYETQATSYSVNLVPNADSAVMVFGVTMETIDGVNKLVAKSQAPTSLFVPAKDIAERCDFTYVAPVITKTVKPTGSVKPTLSPETINKQELEAQIRAEVEKELRIATMEGSQTNPPVQINQNVIQRIVSKIVSIVLGLFSKK